MKQQDEKWAECPQGSLLNLAESQRKSARQQSVMKVVTASSLLCVALFAGYFGISSLAGSGQEPAYEAQFVSCPAVHQLMTPYFENSLSQQQVVNVEHHLEHCRMCRKRYEREADSLGIDFSLAIKIAPITSPIVLVAMF